MGEKQLLPQITITRMQIGEFEVPVPYGLSELLNQSGAWGVKREDAAFLNDYDCRVEKRNGRIFTVLTKRESKTC